MLNRPVSLPLDKLANINYISGEIHEISSVPKRVFSLSKGPFFAKDLEVFDAVTGNPLVINLDYKTVILYQEATVFSSKAVWAGLQIKNEFVSKVRVNYRPIGGHFQNFLGVILEMKDSVDPDFEQRFDFNAIAGKPERWQVAPHTHSFREWEQLHRLIASVYGLYKEICKYQHPLYVTLGSDFRAQMVNKALMIGVAIDDIRQKIITLENYMRYGQGDILITDNPQSPTTYLLEGEWVKLEEVLLIGSNGVNGPGETVGLQLGSNDPSDVVARNTYFWQRQDSANVPLFIVSSDKSTMNEGDTVTFSVNGGVSQALKGLMWKIEGVQPTDVTPPYLTGTIYLDSLGIGEYSVTLNADLLNEGLEFLKFSLAGYTMYYTVVEVTDNSTSATYQVYFADDDDGALEINTAPENALIYLVINTTGLDTSQQLRIRYDGSTVTQADFVSILPTTVNITAPFITIPFQLKEDRLNERSERLNVSLCLSDDIATALVTKSCRIIDTSKVPVYSLYYSSDALGTAEVTQVEEGSQVYLQIRGTNTVDGEQVKLAYTGTYNSADFNQNLVLVTQLVGGSATIPYQILNDTLSEGMEFIVTSLLVNNLVNKTARLEIIDSSNDPEFVIKVSSTRTGVTTLNQMNEGDSGYIYIEMPLALDGSEVTILYSGTTNNADWTTTLPTTLTIQDGFAVAPFTVRADKTTEGEQLLILSLKSQINDDIVATFKLTINDTSVTPTYEVFFSTDEFGRNVIDQVDEGTQVFVQFRTNDLGTQSTHSIRSRFNSLNTTVANGDVVSSTPSTITFINGRATFGVFIRKDQTTEGVESFNVALRATASTSSAILAQGTLAVGDTSQNPTWDLKISRDDVDVVDISGSSVREGETIYAVFDSTNLNIGDVFWLGYYTSGAIITDDDLVDGLPEFFEVTGDRTIIPFTLINDGVNESTERLVINVYRDINRSNMILSRFVDVLNPSFQIKFSPLADGSGSTNIANEGDIVYLTIDSSNVSPSANWRLDYYINGMAVTGSPGDFTQPLVHGVTFSNERTVIPMQIAMDGIADGAKRLIVQLRSSIMNDSIPPLANTFIDINDTSFGGPTPFGTYGPSTIGTLAVAANSEVLVSLVGAGGSGDDRPLGSPANEVLEGIDGESSLLGFAGVNLFTVTGGNAGDQYDNANSGLGGTVFVNTTAIAQATAYAITQIIPLDGSDAPPDGVFGGASVVIGGQGEGSSGATIGHGGGGGAAVLFKIENLTNATITFSVYVGRGGESKQTGNDLSYNNGCVIVSSV